ncbi:MAG: cyclic nucleotide-binding domain-containing protein [Limisphaerales bacterium]
MKILECCKRFPKHAFDKDEIVLKEGSKTGLMYVLVDGSVEITRQGLLLNKISDQGSIFGEVSALLSSPHMATVKALESSRFYVIEDAPAFIRANPEVGLIVATVLAQRLSSVTSHLSSVRQTLDNLMKQQTSRRETIRSIQQPAIGVLQVGAFHKGTFASV